MRLRTTLALAVLLLLAGSVRLARVAFFPPSIDGDERAYMDVATELAAGGGYGRDSVPETGISPLFPLLHAAGIALGVPPLAAGRSVALLASAALAPLCALVAALAAGRLAGLVAGLVVALHPALVAASASLQPEGLAALLTAGGVLALQLRREMPASVATSLAGLARPEVMLLPPVVAMLAARRGWRPALTALVPAILLLGPFVGFVAATTGRVALTGKDRWVFALGIEQYERRGAPIPMPAAKSRLAGIDHSGVAGWALANPAAALRGYAWRTGLLARTAFRTIGGAVAILAAAGAFVALRRRGPAIPVLLPLLLLPVMPVGFVLGRHCLPLVPVAAILSGIAAAQLAGWLTADSPVAYDARSGT